MEPDPAAASPSSSPSSASPSPRSKRRRTDRYALGFEFAPRSAPSAPAPRATPEWTEDSTFALLDAWGERFACAGRRSISAGEWLDVSRIVAAAASRPAGYFSEAQCRNRIDTLRKMFRKEKERSRLAAHRSSNPSPSKWVYFDKMLSLMSPPTPTPPPLLPPLTPLVTRRRDTHPVPRRSWGVDVAELVLAGCSKVEPRNSVSDAQLRENQTYETGAVQGDEFAMLTESIDRLREVYERVENSKRQHMEELKRMRKDMQRELEVRRREILEKAQMEIASLEEDDAEGAVNNTLGDYNGVEEHNNGALDASP
ncbi:trihelix transcription factor ASIL1 [Hordeum vulgare]|uniref:Myb/SANT-like DNA-binding domain-containing protein n=1 Tax=Hordeum vulgare subsp. vulgare TaxID=112509 RepID=A0A8I6X2Z9_HORVV|nr:uncharacterized protein LOC123444287 [Hordeum vulgare subsp. vulgare]KAE8793924.1 trihelix transcription factor ASIL1 [Hordeum vulgare]KAI5000120.1 hypothetical protein ZWY2020_004709 [Hordeum vulgare]